MAVRKDVPGRRRLKAARALNLYTSEGAVDLLVALIRDPTVDVGDRIEAIDDLDDPHAIPLYADFATDLDLSPAHRHAAAVGLLRTSAFRREAFLAEMKDADALGMLLVEVAACVDGPKGRDLYDRLAGDGRVLVEGRLEAALRLAGHGDDRARRHLTRLCADTRLDADQRARVGGALVAFDRPLAAEVLLAAASAADPAGVCLLAAVERLAGVDPRAGADVLAASVANPATHPYYRSEAVKALAELRRS